MLLDRSNFGPSVEVCTVASSMDVPTAGRPPGTRLSLQRCTLFVLLVPLFVLQAELWQFVVPGRGAKGIQVARFAAAQGYFPGVELEEPQEPPSRGSLIEPLLHTACFSHFSRSYASIDL